MKKITTLLLAISLLAIGAGCSEINNQDVGVVTGGIAGGLIGSTIGGGDGQAVAAVGGAIIGAMIGGAIGHSMDEVDKMKMTQTFEHNKTGQAAHWVNPDNGNSYTVVPTATTINNKGYPCREFTTTAMVGGEQEIIHGRACRDKNGQWRVKS